MTLSKIESNLRSYKDALSLDPDAKSRGSGYPAGPIMVTPDPEKSNVDPGIVPEATEMNIFDYDGVEETKGDDADIYIKSRFLARSIKSLSTRLSQNRPIGISVCVWIRSSRTRSYSQSHFRRLLTASRFAKRMELA